MRNLAVGAIVLIAAATLVLGHVLIALAARTSLLAPRRSLLDY